MTLGTLDIMASEYPFDEFRADGRFPGLRTVCHGCRRVAQTHVQAPDDTMRLRTLIVPGDGMLVREVAPGQLASVPCPVCGDSDDSGWMAGFVPPV